jgi:hypothetical protein
MLNYFRITAGLPLFVALALGGASLGYFFGRRFAPPAARAEADPRPVSNVGENKGDDSERERDDSDAEVDHDSDLGRVKAEPTEECKLVRHPQVVLSRLRVLSQENLMSSSSCVENNCMMGGV